jgi:hypothetical protein
MGNSIKNGDFRIDYLGEFEAICETASACESGPKDGWGVGWGKIVEILVTMSL